MPDCRHSEETVKTEVNKKREETWANWQYGTGVSRWARTGELSLTMNNYRLKDRETDRKLRREYYKLNTKTTHN